MSKSKPTLATDGDSIKARRNPHTLGSIDATLERLLRIDDLKNRFWKLKRFANRDNEIIKTAWNLAQSIGANNGVDTVQLEFWILDEECK